MTLPDATLPDQGQVRANVCNLHVALQLVPAMYVYLCKAGRFPYKGAIPISKHLMYYRAHKAECSQGLGFFHGL